VKFHEIAENSQIPAGEYLLHIPSNIVVVCGKHRQAESKIQAMTSGQVFEDEVSNFKRISLTKKERRSSFKSKTCGNCKKAPV